MNALPDKHARSEAHVLQRRAARRRYYEAHREQELERRRLLRQEKPDVQDPEKVRARKKLRNSERSGAVVRPDTCQKCGKGGPVHGHHRDYSKPLEVDWLCTTCHGIEHRKAL